MWSSDSMSRSSRGRTTAPAPGPRSTRSYRDLLCWPASRSAWFRTCRTGMSGMSGALPGSVAEGWCEQVVDTARRQRPWRPSRERLARMIVVARVPCHHPLRVIIWVAGVGDDHGLAFGRDALGGFPADGAGTAGDNAVHHPARLARQIRQFEDQRRASSCSSAAAGRSASPIYTRECTWGVRTGGKRFPGW